MKMFQSCEGLWSWCFPLSVVCVSKYIKGQKWNAHTNHYEVKALIYYEWLLAYKKVVVPNSREGNYGKEWSA